MMTKLEILRVWEDEILKTEAIFSQLLALTGMDPEAPLSDRILGLMSAYTRAIAVQVGDTENDWLDYYWLERSMGQQIGPAPITIHGKDYELRNVEDLLAVIEAK